MNDFTLWRNHWASIRPARIQKILIAILNDIKTGRKIDHRLRAFHDLLGYKAKDNIHKGGLCVGCVYQSQGFRNVPMDQRSGRKLSQTVHVEHTVPIKVLAEHVVDHYATNSTDSDLQLLTTEHWNSTWIYWFLFRYSVTTAMTPEEGHEEPRGTVLKGQCRNTHALTREHDNYLKPMRRYSDRVRIFVADNVDWEIDKDYSFDDHWNLLFKRLTSLGCDYLIPTGRFDIPA